MSAPDPVDAPLFAEDELLPLSGLSHLIFCERRCALVHVEGLWEENRLTVQGAHLHQRVHERGDESRAGVRISRGLPLRSLRLGLSGIADVVELHLVDDDEADDDSLDWLDELVEAQAPPAGPPEETTPVRLAGVDGLWRPLPVEYKRGKPKPDRCDEVQLCAQAMVAAKVANCRTVLLRAVRDGPDSPGAGELRQAAQRLALKLDGLKQPMPLGAVRGIEGESARAYFGAFDHLIVSQKDGFFFHGRSRRPPTDNMNALMSFLYAILTNDAVSALESVGLDPAVGFLHRDRSGRPSLALDLIEEFRPYLADRLALSLVNRRQVQAKGFTAGETGGVQMDDATRKEVLVAYQKRKQEEIQHPFLGESVAVGMLPYVQAQLLARYLRVDQDGYPPFIWK